MKIEGCIFDSLHLAHKFLELAEEGIHELKKDGLGSVIDLEAHIGFLGFYSALDFSFWKGMNDDIWGEEGMPFSFDFDSGEIIAVVVMVSNNILTKVIQHYMGVAERLMNMEER